MLKTRSGRAPGPFGSATSAPTTQPANPRIGSGVAVSRRKKIALPHRRAATAVHRSVSPSRGRNRSPGASAGCRHSWASTMSGASVRWSRDQWPARAALPPLRKLYATTRSEPGWLTA